MIKVLNIISDTNIGGAGKCLLNFLKYYDREKFSVSVAMPVGSMLKAPAEALGAEVFEVDGIGDKSMDFGAIKELRALIERTDPDIVHTHGAMSGRIAGKRAGKKVVYTRHSAFPVKPYLKKGPGKWLNKAINEHYADRIIAVSPACAENLTDAGISPELIVTMMNGVEAVSRSSFQEQAALKEKYGVPPGSFTAGILARLEDYKGHMYILEAADILKKQGRKFTVLIAGKGGYEEELKKRCAELQLSDCVKFLGFVSDVAPLLSILDVQLNASYGTEACSLAILEGFSMGLPIVASRYGGNPWLVEDGENGLLFESRNSRDLAEKLSRLMDSPELTEHMRGRSREIYLSKYTGEIFAGNIENVYLQTLEAESYGK